MTIGSFTSVVRILPSQVRKDFGVQGEVRELGVRVLNDNFNREKSHFYSLVCILHTKVAGQDRQLEADYFMVGEAAKVLVHHTAVMATVKLAGVNTTTRQSRLLHILDAAGG